MAVAGLVALAAECFAGVDVFGTMLRAIGRGFGSGTFAAHASRVGAANPTASARLVTSAVDRSAFAQARRFTAFLRGESCSRFSPSSISLNMKPKH
jgi:hypothetical protein